LELILDSRFPNHEGGHNGGTCLPPLCDMFPFQHQVLDTCLEQLGIVKTADTLKKPLRISGVEAR